MPRPVTFPALLAALVSLAAGCTFAGAAPQPSGSSLTPVPSRDAVTQLRSLATVERSPGAVRPYSRTAFGRAWADVDGNGCNQRDDVLLRDAVPSSTTVQRQGACPHDVLAGTWVDPYSGRTMTFDDLKDRTQAQAIQIDHVVALSEAWVSGASSWPATRREQFANDLSNLLAVDGPTNASKGSYDPAAWRPAKRFQCGYAVRWVEVKHRWTLAVDASERAALEQMLERCPTATR